MKDKINSSNWLPWLISATAALLLFFLIPFVSKYVEWLAIFPVTQAKAVSIVAAIDQFKTGIAQMHPYWNYRIAALLGMIIFFVIGPALWIFSKTESSSKKSCGWYAGTCLVFLGIMIFGYGLQPAIFINKNLDLLIQQNKYTDYLKAELTSLTFKARELYWLPREKGGAQKDFDNITIQELTGGIKSKYYFEIGKSSSDSVLIIYGVSSMKGTNPEFKNINGKTGKIQAAVKVKPSEYNIAWIDSARN